jgi:hypothetical protein
MFQRSLIIALSLASVIAFAGCDPPGGGSGEGNPGPQNPSAIFTICPEGVMNNLNDAANQAYQATIGNPPLGGSEVNQSFTFNSSYIDNQLINGVYETPGGNRASRLRGSSYLLDSSSFPNQWSWTSSGDGRYPGMGTNSRGTYTDRFYETNTCYSTNNSVATEFNTTTQNYLGVEPDTRAAGTIGNDRAVRWVFRAPYGDRRQGSPTDPDTGIVQIQGRYKSMNGPGDPDQINYSIGLAEGWRTLAVLYNNSNTIWDQAVSGLRSKAVCLASSTGARASGFSNNSVVLSWHNGLNNLPIFYDDPSYPESACNGSALEVNRAQSNSNGPGFSGNSSAPRGKFYIEMSCVKPGGCETRGQRYVGVANLDIGVRDPSKLYLFRNKDEEYRGSGSATRSNLLDSGWNNRAGFINWSVGDPGLGIVSASEGNTPTVNLNLWQGGGQNMGGEASRGFGDGCTLWTSNVNGSGTTSLYPSMNGVGSKAYRLSRYQTNPSASFGVDGVEHNSGACPLWFYKNRDYINTNEWTDGLNNIQFCATKYSSDHNGWTLGPNGLNVANGGSECHNQATLIDNNLPESTIDINPSQSSVAGEAAKWLRGNVTANLYGGENTDSGTRSGFFFNYGSMAITYPGQPVNSLPSQPAYSYLNTSTGDPDFNSEVFDIRGMFGLLNYSANNGVQNISNRCYTVNTINDNDPYYSNYSSSGQNLQNCSFNSNSTSYPEGTRLSFRHRVVDNASNAVNADSLNWFVDNTPPNFYPNQSNFSDTGTSGLYSNNVYKNSVISPWVGTEYQVKFKANTGNGSNLPNNRMQYCKVEENSQALATAAMNDCKSRAPGQPGGPVLVDSSDSLQTFTVPPGLADNGRIRIDVKAVDLAGNFQGQDANSDSVIDDPTGAVDNNEGWGTLGTMFVDKNGPTINDNHNPAWRNTNQTVSITADDGTGSGIDNISMNYLTNLETTSSQATDLAIADLISSGLSPAQAATKANSMVDSWDSVTGSSNYSAVFTGNGQRTINLRAADRSGNLSNTRTMEIKIDKIEPQASMTSTVQTAAGYVTLEAQATDPGFNDQAQSGMASGYYQICQGDDTVCTTSSSNWKNINQDVPNNQCSATFDENTGALINGVDVASTTFNSSRDASAEYQSCNMRIADANLVPESGDYSFRFITSDNASNPDQSPIQTKYLPALCDTAATTGGSTQPVLARPTMISTPNPIQQSNAASFSFNGGGGDSYQCRMDDGDWENCTSPRNYSSLADGNHTFRVRSINAAGAESIPTSTSFTIDSISPDTSISNGPSGTSFLDTAEFSFSSSESNVNFECRLDGGAWSICNSPRQYSGISDGSHTFNVRAIDAAGNIDATPASRTWTVNAQPPNTIIDSGPSGLVANASADFTFSSSKPGGTFECRMDGGNWNNCTSPRQYNNLADGSHTFEVRATDTIGNTDLTPASRTWTINSTPPTTVISSSPNNPSFVNSANFVFSATPAAGTTFECRLDGGAWSNCTSPRSLTGLSDGNHTFEVRATGTLGTVEQNPAGFNWTVDSVPPETTITSSINSQTTNNAAVFTFLSNRGGSTFECQLDSGSWSSCTSPQEYFALTDGSHTFRVRALLDGKTDATPASQTWTIDSTPPETTINNAPSGDVYSSSALIDFMSSEPDQATYQCKVDSADWQSCTSGETWNNFAFGPHTFQVRAVDALGNVDPTPASASWNVTLVTLPVIAIDSGPAPLGYSTSANFVFSANQVVTWECRLDAGGWTNCNSPQSYSSLTEGAHSFRVRATDASNNVVYSSVYDWVILPPDNTAPDTNIISRFTNSDLNRDIQFVSNEPNSTFECRTTIQSPGNPDFDSDWISCSSPVPGLNGNSVADGTTINFKVRAIDFANNVDATPAEFTFVRDSNANPTPTIPETTIVNGPSNSDLTQDLLFIADDPDATFECQISNDGTVVQGWFACTLQQMALANFTTLPDGDWSIEVRASNAAGTDPTPAAWNFTVGAVGGLAINSSSVGSFTNNSAIATVNLTGSAVPADAQVVVGYGTVSEEYDFTSDFVNAALGNNLITLESLTPNTTYYYIVGVLWDYDPIEGQYNEMLISGESTFTTDPASAPDTTIDSGPNNTVNSSSAEFTFSADQAGSTFECQLDGGGWTACSSPRNYSSLAEGNHTFNVRAINGGLTDAVPASRTWNIDTTTPNTTINTGPSGAVNSTSANFIFSSSEGGSTFECRIDGGSWSSCTSPRNYTGLSQGSHTVDIRATDSAGNTDSTPASRTWTVDTVAPNTTINTGPSGTVSSTSADFTFSSSEGGSTFECRIDGGSWSSCTSPRNYTSLSNGSHTFDVRATDSTGNLDSTPATRAWTIDSAAPETTINTGPSGSVNSNSASFSFSSNKAGSTFECRIDGGSWSSCTSPRNYTSLSQGSHTFDVRATDSVGNLDSTPASRTWTVDTVAPETTINTGPTNGSNVNSTSASFTFSANETSSFECRIDGGSWSSCTSPRNLTGLSNGSHTFDVRATDSAGNLDSTPASRTWTVDTVAPNTTINTGPSGTVNSTSASFSFSANETSSFECRIDGGSWSSCTSPRNYTGLSNGSHTFDVRATDTAGNLDSTSATRTWTIDTVAPVTTISSGPANGSATNNSSANFAFSSNKAGSTFECRIDGGSWSSCTSPQNYTSLSQGSHTFDVRATDTVGNLEATPVSRTWTVDIVAPDTAIVTGPSGAVNSTSASFTFSASESSTFECRIDGGSWSSCTSPRNYTSLAQGSHTFDVRATDSVGNLDLTPASRTWTVDTVAPDTTINTGPSGTISNTSASFTFSSSEGGSTFECQLDSNPWENCSSPKNYSSIVDGAHTFRVRATDSAGNLDSTPATRTWTVDNIFPETIIDSGPSGSVNSNSASFSFSSDKAGSTFECRIDGGSWSSCTSPRNYTSLAQGSHTFDVRATDTASNVDPSPATRTWTVDTVAPDTTINTGPSGTINSTSASFTFSANETSSFECRIDGGSWSSCTSPRNYTGLSNGSHTVEIRATDSAGNVDLTPASRTWTIDTVAPETAINTGPSGTINSNSASFSFSSNKAGSTFECRIDGGSWSSCTSPRNYAGLSQGSHTFDVRATDTVGNLDSTPASRTWTVDTVAPNTTINTGSSGTISNTSASFTFSSSEGGSTFECRIDGGSWSSCTSPQNYTGLSQGSHTVDIRATDSAGNLDSTPASRTWTVDTVAPETTINTGPSGAINSTSANFTFSSSEAGSTFECRIDGGSWSSCTSPRNYTSLSQGSHTFDVRATDTVGNLDATPTSRTWTVDTVAPDTTINTGPTNGSTINSTSASFAFSASESSTFECRIDGGSWSSCTSPRNYTSLAQGSHTFDVRATDSVGNLDLTPASRTWTIDTVAPETTISSGPANGSTTNLVSASFAFSSSEGGSTFECRIDGGSWSSCTSPRNYTGLSAGSHTFDVRATDSVGNLDATPASRTWTIDTVAPNTVINSGPSGSVNSTSASFGFISSKAGSTFECRIDGGSWSACTSPQSYTGLSQGNHDFEVRATDDLGNVDLSPATQGWFVDTVAPNTSITSGPSGLTASNSASFAFSANETSTFECRIDGGSWSSCTSPRNYTSLAQGSHTFDVRAIDSAGNTDSTPESRTWTVDTVLPVATINSGPSNSSVVNNTSASFTFSSNEAGSTFECSIGGAFTSCSSPYNLSSLSDGTRTFQVRAIDLAGNVSSAQSRTWTVDTVAPNSTILTGPSNNSSVNSTSASFTFSSDEGDATFLCKLDSGSWNFCVSPQTYSGLSEGSHTFSLRSVDLVGNIEATTQTRTWTIDTTAPETSITAGPINGSVVNSNSPSFTFSSNEVNSSFECQIDGGSWSACVSPQNYSSLADGSHTFNVRATDSVGNVDSTPVSTTWTIDTVAPNTTIDSGPSGITETTDQASFTFSSNKAGSSFECQLDGGGWSTCTSPQNYSSLADGSHTFNVRATDSVGNLDSTPASATWIIDTSAPALPETTITNGPTNGDLSQGLVIESDDPAATFECRITLDSVEFADWFSCTAIDMLNADYTTLPDGEWLFEVRAINANGTDLTPAEWSFIVGAISYSLSVDSATPGTQSGSNMPITVDLQGNALPPDAQIAIVYGTATGDYPNVSNLNSAVLGDNVITLENLDPDTTYYYIVVVVWDYDPILEDFNGTLISDEYNFTTDPPIQLNTTIDSTPVGSANKVGENINSTTAAFTFSSNESNTFECQLDGGSWSSCSSPQSYSGLAQGTHQFNVRATEGASNVDPTPATYTWNVDTVAPVVSINSGPSGAITTNSAAFSFSANETIQQYSCQLVIGGVDQAVENCSSPKSYSGLSEASYLVRVNGMDNAGNSMASAATRSFSVDLTPPETTISSGPAEGSLTANSSASFSFSSEAGTTFECSLVSSGGPSYSPCTSAQAYSGLANGSWNFQVRAIDAAGNIDPTPASRAWTITNYSTAVLADSPIAYYKLDDSSGTTAADSGSNSMNLTYHEPATTLFRQTALLPADISSLTNKSVKFNSNNSAIRSNYNATDTRFNLTGNFTLEAWIVAPTSGANRGILDRSNNSYRFRLNNANRVQIEKSGVATVMTTTAALTAGQTYHLVGVKNGTTYSIYINGILANSVTSAQTMNNLGTGGMMTIGASSSGGWFGDQSQMNIDDVSLYDTNLSPAKILEHYNLGLGN